jgi:hypothetical protein
MLRSGVVHGDALDFQDFLKALLTPGRALGAAVAVQDAKIRLAVPEVDDVGVLHAVPPAVHLGQADTEVFGAMALEHSGADRLREHGAHGGWSC